MVFFDRSSFLRDSLPGSAALAGGLRVEARPRLLVVDEDPQMLTMLVCYFEHRGFSVAAATTLREAKELFRRSTAWALVMADFHLPDGTGAELCGWIRSERAAPPPFLLMSGSVNGEVQASGMDYLAKPFAIEQLEERLGVLLARK